LDESVEKLHKLMELYELFMAKILLNTKKKSFMSKTTKKEYAIRYLKEEPCRFLGVRFKDLMGYESKLDTFLDDIKGNTKKMCSLNKVRSIEDLQLKYMYHSNDVINMVDYIQENYSVLDIDSIMTKDNFKSEGSEFESSRTAIRVIDELYSRIKETEQVPEESKGILHQILIEESGEVKLPEVAEKEIKDAIFGKTDKFKGGKLNG